MTLDYLKHRFLGLLRRTFSTVDCNQAKKILYLSLVRSANVLLSDLASSIPERHTKF